MSEIGEMFEGFAEASKLRRASNRENSASILSDHRVHFVSKNDGAHLIVKNNGKVVDFWPGTGLWIDRSNQSKKARGVFPLLKHLGIKA